MLSYYYVFMKINNIKNCTLCQLHKTRTNIVVGNGNIHSKIIFVGEAPGKNEDKQGIPFCGAAGKLLDELLFSINLERNDVYITNIVKCRPPNNRDPLQDEKKICKKYLLEEITYIKPKIIVTLGRHSMYLFLDNTIKISDVHGKVFNIKTLYNNNIILIPLYHPAVALYNPNIKNILFNDFKIIKNILSTV